MHASVPPRTLVSPLRALLAELDPSLPLSDVHTMDQAMDRALLMRRLANRLLTGIALTALLLAAIGIYGVVSVNVNGRVREFGVRMALGARPGDVLRLVVRQGVTLAAIGAGIGLAGAVWLMRYLRTLLFQVDPFDPATFGAVAIALTAVGLMACLAPARRATSADPIVTLGTE